MKKHIRDRRAKQKARRDAGKSLIQAGGTDTWLLESEQEERKNAALIKRSLRWNTESSESLRERLIEIEQRKLEDLDDNQRRALRKEELELVKKLKAKEIAVAVTTRNMLSPNPLVANSAVANLVKMEKQNQDDEHHEEGESTNVNHNISITCTVEERRNRITALSERLGLGKVVDAISCSPTERLDEAVDGIRNGQGESNEQSVRVSETGVGQS